MSDIISTWLLQAEANIVYCICFVYKNIWPDQGGNHNQATGQYRQLCILTFSPTSLDTFRFASMSHLLPSSMRLTPADAFWVQKKRGRERDGRAWAVHGGEALVPPAPPVHTENSCVACKPVLVPCSGSGFVLLCHSLDSTSLLLTSSHLNPVHAARVWVEGRWKSKGKNADLGLEKLMDC